MRRDGLKPSHFVVRREPCHASFILEDDGGLPCGIRAPHNPKRRIGHASAPNFVESCTIDRLRCRGGSRVLAGISRDLRAADGLHPGCVPALQRPDAGCAAGSPVAYGRTGRNSAIPAVRCSSPRMPARPSRRRGSAATVLFSRDLTMFNRDRTMFSPVLTTTNSPAYIVTAAPGTHRPIRRR